MYNKSVAKNIADALGIQKRQNGFFQGDHYLITWAFGHLLQLWDAGDYDARYSEWRLEDLPFIPESFKYKVNSIKGQVDQGAKKQLDLIQMLISKDDVTEVISAFDDDREGQIIGDLIFDYLEVHKPITRLLLNEWTKDAVVKGLKHVRPNREFQLLKQAGVARQWADWVIGINLTRAASVKYGDKKALNIGRVMMPTLRIVYDRDLEIKQFKPKDYYKLEGIFKTCDGNYYQGTYFNNEGNMAFKSADYFQTLIPEMDGARGEIAEIHTKQKKEYPPKLFDLTALQGFITTQETGWTSDKVLNVAQKLYEGKFLTYPRTASSYLDESLIDRAKTVLESFKNQMPDNDGELFSFSASKRIFDSKKVEGHSAIIPTVEIPIELSREEQIVYDAVKLRFLSQFIPAAEYEETELISVIHGAQNTFSFNTKGRVEVEKGWKVLYNKKVTEAILPQLCKNEKVLLYGHEIKKTTTKPPKAHTEDSLLKAMKNCGKHLDEEDESQISSILAGFSIGTPATRAETIKKLRNVGYIIDQGKNLRCTDLGKQMCERFPARKLFDLAFTGQLEKALKDIEKGEQSNNHFLDYIFRYTHHAIGQIKEKEVVIDAVKNSNNLGLRCPICGKFLQRTKWGIGCSGYQDGCRFGISNPYRGKKLSDKQLETLIHNRNTGVIKGFKKKDGNGTYAARLYLDAADQYKVKLRFDNAKKK
ncbi:MAG: DNA topoisomerase [Eubacterium sp.]